MDKIFELLGYDYNDAILLIVRVGVRGLVSLLKALLRIIQERWLVNKCLDNPKKMKKAIKFLGKYHSKKNQK